MKYFAISAPLALLLFSACSGQTLDGGSTAPVDASAGQESPDAAATGASSGGGSGTRGLGESCEGSAECAAGFECLPFAVHPKDEACKVVSKMCTKACVSGEDDGCSGLGAPAMCFAGCSEGEAVCGKVGASSGDKVTFTISDAPEALTSSADDALFTLTVTTLSRPYAAASVAIVVEAPGDTGMIVPCKHDDKNKDGNVDVGDTLQCSEPPVNEYGPSHVGKTFGITFVERSDPSGPYQTRGTGTWKPAN